MTTEIIITKEGVKKRDITETDLDIQDSLADAFSASVVRPVNRLLSYGGNFGNVAVAAAGAGYTHFSVEVTTLPLRCHCNTESGIVVPVFDNPDCPLLPMQWIPPKGMRIVLCITAVWNKESNKYYPDTNQYLVALDPHGRMYRLPTSNLHTDCKLCHNMNHENHRDAMGVVKQACEQFERSEWNDHLYRGDSPVRRQCTKLMFRWKPTDETFEQLPPEVPAGRDWTALCEKVAVDKLNSIIIPPLP